MLNLFDTHAHLYAKEFSEDQEDVIKRATNAGISRIICVGASDGFKSAEQSIELAEKYDFIWASAGIHPHDASLKVEKDKLIELARHPKVVAIGETGLDYYRDWSPKTDQINWFRNQIEIALQLDKPLIIHSREAGSDCLKILKENGASKVGGVFHCYAEDGLFAQELAKINFLVSFPGVLTFKKSELTRQIAKEIPIEQILLETDSPYLAPEPYRGKRCESAYTLETARTLADIKGLTLEEVAEITTRNALNLFKINQ